MTGAGMDRTFIMPLNMRNRLFYLDHPDCIVEGLTVKGAQADTKGGNPYGTGVWIGTRGGTLRRCRVTECTGKSASIQGAVAISSEHGLVDRCIISDNINDYNGMAGGVYLSAGCLENSLIYGNRCLWEGGGVFLRGGAVRNCTIVDNTASTRNGGGLYWSGSGSEGICLQNLIVTGNHAPADASSGSPEWNAGDNRSAMNAKTANCHFGHAEPIGEHPIGGEAAFADPSRRDYSLLAGSSMIDAGSSYEPMGESDLGGGNRISGSAVDLGCYEFDYDAPRCGFTADVTAVFEGEPVAFSSAVYAVPDGVQLAYDWALTNRNTGHVETLSGAQPTWTSTEAGWYDVALTVTGGAGYSLSSGRLGYVHVVPTTTYAAAPGDATVIPAYPWKTPGTASTNLPELVAEAIDGSTIRFLEGEFKIPDQIHLDRKITMTGAGMDRTVIMPSKMKNRLFFLNHPDCIVEGLTVKGAQAEIRESGTYGSGVLVGARGGTLRRCRVTQCKGLRQFHLGTVAIMGDKGLVTHCIINNNTNDNRGSGGGVYVKAGRLENCLISGNYVTSSGGGIYYQDGVARCCTVVGNSADDLGGGFYGVWIDNSGQGKACIQNSIFAGNKAGGDTSEGSPEWNVPPKYVKLKEKISNCLFKDSIPLGQNARTGDPMFLDPANNDYRISRNSPAHDAGLYGEWMDGTTDLAGNPRVDHGHRVDIGCYELSYVPPATILMLR